MSIVFYKNEFNVFDTQARPDAYNMTLLRSLII